MAMHSIDESAANEGTAQARAFVSSRPRRTGCRVHVRVTSDAKASHKALKKSQLEIAFRQQPASIDESLSPAMLAYLHGANSRDC